MRDILLDYLKKHKVIIYGCGKNGKILQWILNENHVGVSYMCDQNEKLWGEKINGVECISPSQLFANKDAVVIIGIARYQDILDNLSLHGFLKILTWDDMRILEICDKISGSSIIRFTFPGLEAELKGNVRFKNIHEGKRCFIIGNGPSVRDLDLSLLHDEFTFTVNQMARSPQFADINTQYHLWADPNFFKTELSCEGDYKLLEIMRQLPQNVECFFPYTSAHAYIDKFELEKDINVNYYVSSDMIGECTEIDFTQYVRGGYTVVQFAIRLAIYMGFSEIYILGCECTTILNVINARLSEYTSVTHCYDIDEKEKERAKKMYFSLPMQEYYRAELGVLEEYRKLRKYCEQRKIRLYNCTTGGLLTELERIPYETVMKGMN